MIVGFCGNLQRPSKSRALVEEVAQRLAARHSDDVEVIDVVGLLPELGQAVKWPLPERIAAAIAKLRDADALVVGTPVYKGSYTGLFKHFIDLIDPNALAGKPVVITATGGGDRHALVVEHQLRPLFGFFTAHCASTTIYASDKDFVECSLQSAAVLARIELAIDDLDPVLFARRRVA